MRSTIVLSLVTVLACSVDEDAQRFADEDRDGVRAPYDCDDTTPNFGLGPEIPYDGVDNDCDTRTPDDDFDGDGVNIDDDCDDQDRTVQEHGVWTRTLTASQVPEPCAGRCSLVVEGGVEHRGQTDLDLGRYHCVASIGTFLAVADDATIESLRGLESLTEVGQSLMLVDLPALRSLEGLEGLASLNGGVWLQNADVLENLSGLQVASLPVLTVLQNASLVDLADAPIRVTRSLSIRDNPSLEGLDGIEVDGALDLGLSLIGNPGIDDLSPLIGLTRASDVTLAENGPQDLRGLDNLETVAGSVVIDGNPELASLAGLEGLRAIDGDLRIEDNPALVDLSALEGLGRVGGDLVVRGNPALPPAEVAALLDGLVVGGAVDAP